MDSLYTLSVHVAYVNIDIQSIICIPWHIQAFILLMEIIVVDENCFHSNFD